MCKNMKLLENRAYGKGMMYVNDYFEEVIKDHPDGYKGYYADQRYNHKNIKNPFFKTGNDFCQYIEHTGVCPSEALQCFLEGPTMVGCGSSIEAVYHKTILDILGKEKFDILFSQRHQKLKISRFVSFNEHSSLSPFLR